MGTEYDWKQEFDIEYEHADIKVGIKEMSQDNSGSYINDVCLHCYTRDWVKREEMKILQCQTTTVYMQFVCHPLTISHASM